MINFSLVNIYWRRFRFREGCLLVHGVRERRSKAKLLVQLLNRFRVSHLNNKNNFPDVVSMVKPYLD